MAIKQIHGIFLLVLTFSILNLLPIQANPLTSSTALSPEGKVSRLFVYNEGIIVSI